MAARAATTVVGCMVGIGLGMNRKKDFEDLGNKCRAALGMATSKTPVDMNSAKDLMKQAVTICDASEFAVLSNKGKDGSIASRMIEPFKTVLDEEGSPIVSFNTNKLSRKYEELKKNPQVTVTYMDKNNLAYVVFKGEAKQVQAPESQKYWCSSLLLFYPEGGDEAKGSRFTAWEVKPEQISMCDISQNVTPTQEDWRPPELRKGAKSSSWEIVCKGRLEDEAQEKIKKP